MNAVEAFSKELSTMTDTKPPVSRGRMTAITNAAMKAHKHYKHVVMLVEKFIWKCRPEYKVQGLYVIDSIVRQSRHQYGAAKDQFGPRFSKNLTRTFEHLYKCPQEEQPKVLKVLNLWQKNAVYGPEILQPLISMATSAGSSQSSSNGPAVASGLADISGHTQLLTATLQRHQEELRQLQELQQQLQLQEQIRQQLAATTQLQAATTLSGASASDQTAMLQAKIQALTQLKVQHQKEQMQVSQVAPSKHELASILSSVNAATGTAGNGLAVPSLAQQSVQQPAGQQSHESWKMRQAGMDSNPPVAVTTDPLEFSADSHITALRQQLWAQEQAVIGGQAPPQQGQEESALLANVDPERRALWEQQIQQLDQESGGTFQESHPTGSSGRKGRRHHRSSRSRSYSRSPPRRKSSRWDSHARKRSRSRSPDHERRRRRRSRSRSSDRRQRRRDAEREAELAAQREAEQKQREIEIERKKCGFPSSQEECLTVCSNTIWVGHLPKTVMASQLADVFEEYGQISAVDVVGARGCAYVAMMLRIDAVHALASLQSKRFRVAGQVAKVAWAPGKGIKAKELKDYWNSELGASFIPWDYLGHPPYTIRMLSEGCTIDMTTLSPALQRQQTGASSSQSAELANEPPSSAQTQNSLSKQREQEQVGEEQPVGLQPSSNGSGAQATANIPTSVPSLPVPPVGVTGMATPMLMMAQSAVPQMPPVPGMMPPHFVSPVMSGMPPAFVPSMQPPVPAGMPIPRPAASMPPLPQMQQTPFGTQMHPQVHAGMLPPSSAHQFRPPPAQPPSYQQPPTAGYQPPQAQQPQPPQFPQPQQPGQQKQLPFQSGSPHMLPQTQSQQQPQPEVPHQQQGVQEHQQPHARSEEQKQPHYGQPYNRQDNGDRQTIEHRELESQQVDMLVEGNARHECSRGGEVWRDPPGQHLESGHAADTGPGNRPPPHWEPPPHGPPPHLPPPPPPPHGPAFHDRPRWHHEEPPRFQPDFPPPNERFPGPRPPMWRDPGPYGENQGFDRWGPPRHHDEFDRDYHHGPPPFHHGRKPEFDGRHPPRFEPDHLPFDEHRERHRPLMLDMPGHDFDDMGGQPPPPIDHPSTRRSFYEHGLDSQHFGDGQPEYGYSENDPPQDFREPDQQVFEQGSQRDEQEFANKQCQDLPEDRTMGTHGQNAGYESKGTETVLQHVEEEGRWIPSGEESTEGWAGQAVVEVAFDQQQGEGNNYCEVHTDESMHVSQQQVVIDDISDQPLVVCSSKEGGERNPGFAGQGEIISVEKQELHPPTAQPEDSLVVQSGGSESVCFDQTMAAPGSEHEQRTSQAAVNSVVMETASEEEVDGRSFVQEAEQTAVENGAHSELFSGNSFHDSVAAEQSGEGTEVGHESSASGITLDVIADGPLLELSENMSSAVESEEA